MKTLRMFLVGLCLLMCLSLNSCVYTSANLIRVQGTNLDCSVNPLIQQYNFKGDEIAVTIFRQSGTMKRNKDGSIEKPIPMPDISETTGTWKLDNAPQSKLTD